MILVSAENWKTPNHKSLHNSVFLLCVSYKKRFNPNNSNLKFILNSILNKHQHYAFVLTCALLIADLTYLTLHLHVH